MSTSSAEQAKSEAKLAKREAKLAKQKKKAASREKKFANAPLRYDFHDAFFYTKRTPEEDLEGHEIGEAKVKSSKGATLVDPKAAALLMTGTLQWFEYQTLNIVEHHGKKFDKNTTKNIDALTRYFHSNVAIDERKSEYAVVTIAITSERITSFKRAHKAWKDLKMKCQEIAHDFGKRDFDMPLVGFQDARRKKSGPRGKHIIVINKFFQQYAKYVKYRTKWKEDVLGKKTADDVEVELRPQLSFQADDASSDEEPQNSDEVSQESDAESRKSSSAKSSAQMSVHDEVSENSDSDSLEEDAAQSSAASSATRQKEAFKRAKKKFVSSPDGKKQAALFKSAKLSSEKKKSKYDVFEADAAASENSDASAAEDAAREHTFAKKKSKKDKRQAKRAKAAKLKAAAAAAALAAEEASSDSEEEMEVEGVVLADGAEVWKDPDGFLYNVEEENIGIFDEKNNTLIKVEKEIVLLDGTTVYKGENGMAYNPKTTEELGRYNKRTNSIMTEIVLDDGTTVLKDGYDVCFNSIGEAMGIWEEFDNSVNIAEGSALWEHKILPTPPNGVAPAIDDEESAIDDNETDSDPIDDTKERRTPQSKKRSHDEGSANKRPSNKKKKRNRATEPSEKYHIDRSRESNEKKRKLKKSKGGEETP